MLQKQNRLIAEINDLSKEDTDIMNMPAGTKLSTLSATQTSIMQLSSLTKELADHLQSLISTLGLEEDSEEQLVEQFKSLFTPPLSTDEDEQETKDEQSVFAPG